MDVHTNIPLKNYLTMRVGGNARFMADALTADEMAATCRSAKAQGIPFFVLGGGSNIIAKDEGFNGLVIRNRIPGFTILDENSTTVTIKIGGGENWDETVKRSVDMRLSGIEALSAIPGTVGAAPVQNIGAYGQELADTFVELEAYDSQTDQMVSLASAECGFSYRHSIFRGEQAGRYAITSVTLRLFRAAPQPPFYQALQQYFDQHSVTLFTPGVVRDAVVAIRANKLPDPKDKPNAGSFFKNAIIEDWQLDELLKTWPDMPHYDLGNSTYKVPTGWLIEKCGLRGKLLHGFRVHDGNALVLINESAGSYADLSKARDEIIGAVRDQFRIMIEQEPLEV